MQDLLADPLMMGGGGRGMVGGSAAAAAGGGGAQGVLVKDILSAEEELRVSVCVVGFVVWLYCWPAGGRTLCMHIRLHSTLAWQYT